MEEREKREKKLKEKKKWAIKKWVKKIHRTTEVFLWVMRKGEEFFRYP